MRTFLLFLVLTVAGNAVTPPTEIKVPAGFKVELLREAAPGEGSWICMAIDDAGRLYISSQDKTPGSGFTKDSKWGGMWRTTLDAQGHVAAWDRVNVPVGDAMGMLWAFDSLYVSGNGPEGRGIYRCKDTDRDGNLDRAVLFKAMPEGSGEHGAHAIILGPDKKLYIVNGNTTPILDGLSPDSPYRNWGEDDLLPRVNDPIATFFDKIKAPYGCVYRTDENGTKWELFAGGFRNPYDIAFNADGELFTYDSDMEWDRGLPWYRPTRIIHVVPGGEYGFREGSAKWPAYFPDSLPAVADIGVGCPTGMKFGTGARGWPERYQRALFMIDWTYGRILAVHLHEKGASYTARNDIKSYTYPKEAETNHDVEVFLSGKGMPMTDMEFGKDGALYFTTGGRGTSAALYRVSYEGKDAATLADDGKKQDTADKERRRNLLALRVQSSSQPPGAFSLGYGTTFYRHPTRMALEKLEAFEIKTQILNGSKSLPNGGFVLKDYPHVAQLEREKKRQEIEQQLRREGTYTVEAARKLFAQVEDETLRWLRNSSEDVSDHIPEADRNDFAALSRILRESDERIFCRGLLTEALSLARIGDAPTQNTIFEMFERISSYPQPVHWSIMPRPQGAKPPAKDALLKLSDDLKFLKLRVLEVSFARQGRPSEERVKSVMEGLLAHYPAPANPPAKVGDGKRVDSGSARAPRAVSGASPETPDVGRHPLRTGPANENQTTPDASGGAPDAARGARALPIPKPAADAAREPGAAASARNPAAGAPVDDPAWRLNRELCALLVWLSNPEIGELNSELPPKAAGAPWNAAGSNGATPLSEGKRSGAEQARTTDQPPTTAPASKSGVALTLATALQGPVPNPGAAIFPGRKPAPFQTELGRQVIEKTLALMDAAPSQEEQIWYAVCLGWAHGWTPEQRTRYFRWFHEKAAGYTGGNSFTGFLNKIRAEALARCTPEERAALGTLASAPTVKPLVDLKPRAFVQAWTMADLEPSLADVGKGRNFARGRELFGQAQCIFCHKMGVTGGNVGPDLTAVAARFPRKDILTAILDPNKDVSDQYAMMTFTVRRGEKLQEVTGLVQEDTGGTFTVLTDPLAGTTQAFYHHVVVKKEKANVSIMPPGLLNTLTKDEVLDLLAYLEAGGKAEAGNFK